MTSPPGRTTKEGIGVYSSQSPSNTNPSASTSTSSPTPISTCRCAHGQSRPISHCSTKPSMSMMLTKVGESSAGPSGSWSDADADADGFRRRSYDIVEDGMDNQRRPRQCHCRRRRHKRIHPTLSTAALIATIPPFLLPFLPTTTAAPAPPPSRSLPPSHRPFLVKNDVQTPSITLTYDPTPTFPPIIDVDETAIPFMLTQNPDGTWERVQGGWLLYGRRGVATTAVTGSNTVSATTTTSLTSSGTGAAIASFAVVSALPNGWGSTSNRTSIYKVPLIVVASCVMAVAIVAFLIFIVISRRRRHRREKRAKDRMRRKALAAAGLSEADINDKAAKAAFKEKLGELEAQRKSKMKNKNGKNGEGGSSGQKMPSPSGKVRGWNKRLGLRRRKGAPSKVQGGENVDEVEEDASIDMAIRSVSSRTRNPQDSDQTSVGSHHLSDEPNTTEMEQDTPLSDDDRSNEQTLGSPTLPTPYFPPAYRPASVRSMGNRGNVAGPSHSHSPPDAVDANATADPDDPIVLSGPEKTQAPGYYPAPATEDGEVAFAIVSRSDGKARMIDPLPSSSSDVELNAEGHEQSRSRTRHVATDDKRVLEQLRLGASAPPTSGLGSDVLASIEERTDYLQELGIELGHGLGPSAPSVQLDEHGFEVPDIAVDVDEGQNRLSNPNSSKPTSTLFPPPPALRTRRSSPSPSPLMDDSQHRLPSAPPVHADGEDAHVPSAPPITLNDGDEEDDGDASAPSAPPLEEEAEGTVSESGEGEWEDEDESSTGRESREESTSAIDVDGAEREGGQKIYLPRYEP